MYYCRLIHEIHVFELQIDAILSYKIMRYFGWLDSSTARALHLHRRGQACVSQKTRKLHEPEKLFVKLRHADSVKLVFSYVVKGIEMKITAKFRGTFVLKIQRK